MGPVRKAPIDGHRPVEPPLQTAIPVQIDMISKAAVSFRIAAWCASPLPLLRPRRTGWEPFFRGAPRRLRRPGP